MKKATHPTYFPDAKIICACGHTFSIGSTVKEIHVEICSNCHPFYTGKEKLIDTAGRVDRFKKMQVLKDKASQTRKGKAAKKARSAERKVEKEKAKFKAEIKANDAPRPKTAKKAKVATKK